MSRRTRDPLNRVGNSKGKVTGYVRRQGRIVVSELEPRSTAFETGLYSYQDVSGEECHEIENEFYDASYCNMTAKFCAVVASVLLTITAPVQLVALDETYLRCKGTIAIFYESGVQSLENQEITAHIVRGRINFSGSSLLGGADIPICTERTDDFYFDSQSCKEGGAVDLSRPRQYGTVSKVTGELHLSNEAPKLSLAQGSFICKRAEPVMK
jgi:hypothetical protein